MQSYQLSLFAIPSAVTAAVLLLFALLVPATRFSPISLVMSGAAFVAGAWQLACAFMFSATDARTALVWARVGCAFLAFFAPAVYHFVATILPSAAHRKIVARAAWIIAAQAAILTFATDYVVSDVGRFWWGFYPQFHAIARVLYPLFLAGLLAAAAVEMMRFTARTTAMERTRTRLFTIAASFAFLTVIDLFAMYGIAVYPFGWLLLLTALGVVIHTLVRYRMVPAAPPLAAAEIISTMRDLLLVSDRDGSIRFANNAACAFLGYPQEELVGRPLEEVLVPAGGETQPLQGWVRDREYIFRTKMGQPIELTLSHSPISHQGEAAGAVIIGRDLRERKRYEWEARRAVTLLESTLDSTADGILVIGEHGRVLTWNQRFVEMWGIPAELIQRPEDHDLIAHLADQLRDPDEFLESLEERTHPEVESVHVLQFRDGRRLEQYSIGRYLDNAPLRVWSFRDVTARLAAEEALRESEIRYRLLFEQNAAGVCLATFSGRIVDCNATFADLVGYEVDELRNRDLRDVFKRASAVDELRRRLETTPTVRGIEIDMRRRGGELISAVANVSILGQGEDAVLHMTAVDISDRKRAEEQVEFQAYHDVLTQLPNRRLFMERLELALLAARRARANVGVLFIDLDRFKSINDTLGHGVADRLLVEVAQRLRSCVRQTDTVARHGGDEFTIILPDLNQPEDAAQVAEKILERVVEPVAAGTAVMAVTASIGIAVYPYDGTDIDTLLRNADDAMYRAKEAGRNTYQLCTEQMKTRAMERLSMQSRLRKAMSDGELVLAYQPIRSLGTDTVVGAEAMVRWNDPERGVMEASDFITLAEETRLIVPLGEWMLVTACRQIRQWADAGLPVRVGVNISARQFQQRDLSTVVRRSIDECGIDPALIELEIHEATAMRDVGLTVELFKLIRDVGVSVSIDDFGSAHSSLGSLRVLPINAVKMDRGLVEDVTTVAADAAIVDAVIAVSQTLGLRVAADGVTTREQFDFLKSRGCQEAQGSYLSGPLDAESFSEMMKSLTVNRPPTGA